MKRVLLLALLCTTHFVNIGFAQTSSLDLQADPRTAFEQAFEHYKNKRYAEAEQLFSNGLRARPADAQAHFYLAESLLALGKRTEAKTSFETALRLGLPDNPKARAVQMIAELNDPFTYFLQAGAYARSDDADQQRAKLISQGFAVTVSQRELNGRTIYRLRLGPFQTSESAKRALEELETKGIEAAVVRVQK